MKKLYLLLLVFLLLFIPATNAVTPYQLDHPIRELNNHTLREIFEQGNLDINYPIFNANGYANTYISNIVMEQNSYYYVNNDYTLYSTEYGGSGLGRMVINSLDHRFFNTLSYEEYNNYNRSSKTKFSGTSGNYIITYYGSSFGIDTYIKVTNQYIINQTYFNIDNLTVEQMDMYYDYYLEAVKFEIDYYEAGLDPGEYQHIFKSILNGVKNLISEMGYVWQWLNAPIITTDMQDYSFNIDWSWDLIGVIRQIMNSAGILTLQIAFWVPSLAFAFMGIPVQVSVLSLLFSNLIFLLLGWILVKSLLI